MQTCHPNPSMPPFNAAQALPFRYCASSFFWSRPACTISSLAALQTLAVFPAARTLPERNSMPCLRPGKHLGLDRSAFLPCGYPVSAQRLAPLSNEPMPQMKKAPETGAFYECHMPDGYLKSSRSCTLALSVRSSTSTPLGGVNWKVPLPSMTSGMNLVKFTSL